MNTVTQDMNVLTRINGTIFTLAEVLADGGKIVAEQESKVQYNRHKFNAMDYDAQREYMKKVDAKVTRYYVVSKDGYYIKTTKRMHDNYTAMLEATA